MIFIKKAHQETGFSIYCHVLKKVDYCKIENRSQAMKTKISTPSQRRYSQAFKLQVVREYERGFQTKDELIKKYRLGGHSIVLQWCRKYGKLYYPKTKAPGRPMKYPQKQRIKELEAELKEAREKILVYEKLIEVSNRESGIDLRKNIATKLSENWQPKGK